MPTSKSAMWGFSARKAPILSYLPPLPDLLPVLLLVRQVQVHQVALLRVSRMVAFGWLWQCSLSLDLLAAPSLHLLEGTMMVMRLSLTLLGDKYVLFVCICFIHFMLTSTELSCHGCFLGKRHPQDLHLRSIDFLETIWFMVLRSGLLETYNHSDR